MKKQWYYDHTKGPSNLPSIVLTALEMDARGEEITRLETINAELLDALKAAIASQENNQ